MFWLIFLSRPIPKSKYSKYFEKSEEKNIQIPKIDEGGETILFFMRPNYYFVVVTIQYQVVTSNTMNVPDINQTMLVNNNKI